MRPIASILFRFYVRSNPMSDSDPHTDTHFWDFSPYSIATSLFLLLRRWHKMDACFDLSRFVSTLFGFIKSEIQYDQVNEETDASPISRKFPNHSLGSRHLCDFRSLQKWIEIDIQQDSCGGAFSLQQEGKDESWESHSLRMLRAYSYQKQTGKAWERLSAFNRIHFNLFLFYSPANGARFQTGSCNDTVWTENSIRELIFNSKK